jgi:DNA ligase (NAD+)
VEQLGIKIGSTVLIERSADVIPKITGCVKSDNDSTRPVDGPAVDWKSCPCELKQPLIPSETGIDMFCRSPDCPEQRSRVIRHFVSRDALSMDGFGPRSIDDLIDGGFLADVADIFDLELHREAMEKLEGWGPRSVEVLLQGIETGKKLSNMERVLNGLGS